MRLLENPSGQDSQKLYSSFLVLRHGCGRAIGVWLQWQPTPVFLCRIPRTEEPIESQRVTHNWSNLAHAHSRCSQWEAPDFRIRVPNKTSLGVPNLQTSVQTHGLFTQTCKEYCGPKCFMNVIETSVMPSVPGLTVRLRFDWRVSCESLCVVACSPRKTNPPAYFFPNPFSSLPHPFPFSTGSQKCHQTPKSWC